MKMPNAGMLECWNDESYSGRQRWRGAQRQTLRPCRRYEVRPCRRYGSKVAQDFSPGYNAKFQDSPVRYEVRPCRRYGTNVAQDSSPGYDAKFQDSPVRDDRWTRRFNAEMQRSALKCLVILSSLTGLSSRCARIPRTEVLGYFLAVPDGTLETRLHVHLTSPSSTRTSVRNEACPGFTASHHVISNHSSIPAFQYSNIGAI